MNYICPVCGYNELPYPPEDWMICPCCKTMFGYSDLSWGIDVLRAEWIQAGAKWGDDNIPRPDGWSPIQQLLNIGYQVSDADKIAIARLSDNNIGIINYNFIQGNPFVVRSVNMSGDQESEVIKFLVGEYNFEQHLPPVDRPNLSLQPT